MYTDSKLNFFFMRLNGGTERLIYVTCFLNACLHVNVVYTSQTMFVNVMKR